MLVGGLAAGCVVWRLVGGIVESFDADVAEEVGAGTDADLSIMFLDDGWNIMHT
jgi:hypothetical protein